MPKFYVQLRCPFIRTVLRQFVVQAASEHEAIASLWRSEFRAMHKVSDEHFEHLIRGRLFCVDMTYSIHQGCASEAVEVSSAPALRLLDERHRGYVLRCLGVMFEPAEVQDWLRSE